MHSIRNAFFWQLFFFCSLSENTSFAYGGRQEHISLKNLSGKLACVIIITLDADMKLAPAAKWKLRIQNLAFMQ
jgi:hypothetical protein